MYSAGDVDEGSETRVSWKTPFPHTIVMLRYESVKTYRWKSTGEKYENESMFGYDGAILYEQ